MCLNSDNCGVIEMAQSLILKKLSDLGQSVWYDNISRELIQSGGLGEIVENGVTGLTSNPSIFEKAISTSSVYDSDIESLARNDLRDDEIFEALAISDIQDAADLLSDIYHATGQTDGFVSLEVNPHLATDTKGTIKEARKLFQAVDRPNLMIKVPATPAGIPAIKTLISEGINVNVTLIFSRVVYGTVREAYISGLEELSNRGGDLSKVSSVASFFVSRVDTAIDGCLEESGQHLIGKSAIANAKAAYTDFRQTFSLGRYQTLQNSGAKVQRPLWASTSVKNPDFSDVMYVDSLIGSDTVNTMPDVTLDAYKDHGNPSLTIESNLDDSLAHLDMIEDAGVNMDEITEKLLVDGLKAFSDSYDQLIENISDKRTSLLVEQQSSD